jgi:hypothetical protein
MGMGNVMDRHIFQTGRLKAGLALARLSAGTDTLYPINF